MNTKPCTICGITMHRNGRSYSYFYSRKFCSQNCYHKSESYERGLFKKGHEGLSGENNPMWKGGITEHHSGYLKISVGKKKYKLLHRKIMEDYLGRKLLRSEDVHHINENKKDNRIENLQVMSKSEHSSLHNSKGRRIGTKIKGL